ncbi:hypothetical protein SK128_002773 [Halocaridina rubra]|uniref:Uncharacterized protein n=1 Tax=Halocaridina rubra TaxID=373956 RepID=A0AAN9ABB8_HALRR
MKTRHNVAGNINVDPGDSGQVTQGSTHSSPISAAAPAMLRTEHKHRKSSANIGSLIKRESNKSFPTNLISAANQQKATITVKQKLPMKLAK